ncbi:hypothetical protein AK812_SmicGene25801 [Symbiodinium microadriaticum]|uniref:Uncharacterized protein n=1 Tax=Symbiodinium microadriaticum TaxID=2951 RepID=A0A1Q9DB74_SYMMI|nr:hypothetical protein AK812_SmicGene25801 [Symbiodinium microadriaticum]CAE7197697.1 unnamed protein product [Symbiodinium microadriaticum]CAE7922675.1 unnamed protein product [Symbiodinium sp. KB8]
MAAALPVERRVDAERAGDGAVVEERAGDPLPADPMAQPKAQRAVLKKELKARRKRRLLKKAENLTARVDLLSVSRSPYFNWFRRCSRHSIVPLHVHFGRAGASPLWPGCSPRVPPRWTATLETSLRSGLKDRLHLHVFMEFNKAVDWTGLRAVTFNGVRPNAQATAGRGAKMRELKNHGHFYVFADKVGTLKVATSGYELWKDYPVKVSQVRLGFLGRLKQVESVRFHERLGEHQAQQIATEQRLQALQRPFRPEVLAALQPWAAQYSTDQLRCKFLVLRGGSHGYILFDNVNDMQFVLDHRALAHSNNSVHTLGQSQTGMYAYRVWLFKVPIVMTVDDSAGLAMDPRKYV